jgi:hypothetical protein
VNDPRGWLEREIAREAGLIAQAVAADPMLPFSYDDFSSEVDFLSQFARLRPVYIGCLLSLDDARIPGSCAPGGKG